MKTFLFLSLLAGPVFSATLTVYTTPPKVPLDWKSPGALFSSVFSNKLRFEKRPLGLTAVKISCADLNQTQGLVPSSLGILGEVLIEGRGLGLLYHTFPGELIDVSEELKKNLQNEKTRFVRVQVSEKQCQRLIGFLKEFREKKVPEKFGFPHRPLMAEGGSDTSFAVAVLEVAGVLDQKEKDAWESVVYLPDELSGMPLHEKYVNPFSVARSKWGESNAKSTPLKFWDPQKISSWVDAQKGTVKEDKATGVEINRSHLPPKEGSWWGP